MTLNTQSPTPTVPTGYEFVCHRSTLPVRGKKTVQIAGLTVLLIACDTALYAVENRCPQTGGSIAHGEVLGCAITAPTTGARYCLRTGRYLEGGQLPLASHALHVFAVYVSEDRVYVRI